MEGNLTYSILFKLLPNLSSTNFIFAQITWLPIVLFVFEMILLLIEIVLTNYQG